MTQDLSNWTPCPRPEDVRLTGPRVALETLDGERHGQGLFEAVAGEANTELWRYMPIGPFLDYDKFARVFERVRISEDWHTLVILDARTGVALGMASYMRIRAAHGSIEVGCVSFGDQLKRTAHATEAMHLMAAHVFDDLGYRRYEWKCNNANEASKRAALRFGYQFEGVFRNDMVMKGRNRDTAWYTILDDEWASVKAALDAWLAPENFDSAGKQIKRLEDFR